MAEPVKPYSPRMFSKTDKVYASAKQLVIRDMCVDPDELVFTLAQNFLNSPTKIFFKMAAKLAKTTAILREKTP